MEKIEIEKVPDVFVEGSFSWTVRFGDKYEDRLDASEALWCAACILTGRAEPPFLRTKAQHDAWDARYAPKAPLEDHQKLFPLVEQQGEQNSDTQ